MVSIADFFFAYIQECINNIYQVMLMKHLINYAHYFIITLIIIGLVFIIPFDDTPVNSIATESPLIIIDAGHGGKDGGAVASDGTQEQYLNLAIALDMYEYLNNLGIKSLEYKSSNGTDFKVIISYVLGKCKIKARS